MRGILENSLGGRDKKTKHSPRGGKKKKRIIKDCAQRTLEIFYYLKFKGNREASMRTQRKIRGLEKGKKKIPNTGRTSAMGLKSKTDK